MKKFPGKRGVSLWLAVLTALLLAVPGRSPLAPTALAVTQEEIDGLKGEASDLAQQRKELNKQIADIQDDISQAVAQRTLLDQQMVLTEKQIVNTESQIAGYELLLEQTAYELEENKKEEEAQYELFCQRARMMEEKGTPSYWSVLFNAADFSDLLSRLADIQSVLDYDQKVIDDLQAIRAKIEEKQAYQEQLLAETEAAKVELENHKADLAQQRAEADWLVDKLKADEEAWRAAEAELREEENAIQNEIDKKTKELEEQMLREQMSWAATSGGYIWPEKASKRITSPMGSRNTGIPGASTNHKGVDIGGVGYTTNVLAAKAGVVIISKYSSSYGNYVVISHGKGNTTLYAHMSSRSVSEGDSVSQGQVIGITGCTGISRGAHLHYEIVENGSRVNPLDYLPGYVKAW